jgi:hypothetical protein
LHKKPLLISFCTTCMGRLDHLKKTLPANLKSCENDPNVQFVVLNYGGEAPTEQWIKETFPDELASGKLKYVSYPAAKHFNMPHAKNMAHRCADGDVLCNLDADQFIGDGFSELLRESFTRSGNIFMRHSPVALSAAHKEDGASGKLALTREAFYRLRGYDESFTASGDDRDLHARLITHGYAFRDIPVELVHGIAHTDTMRIENHHPEDQEKRKAAHALKAKEVSGGLLRRHLGKAGRFAGNLLKSSLTSANPEGNFGNGTVYDSKSGEALEIGTYQPPHPLLRNLVPAPGDEFGKGEVEVGFPPKVIVLGSTAKDMLNTPVAPAR